MKSIRTDITLEEVYALRQRAEDGPHKYSVGDKLINDLGTVVLILDEHPSYGKWVGSGWHRCYYFVEIVVGPLEGVIQCYDRCMLEGAELYDSAPPPHAGFVRSHSLNWRMCES